MITRRMAMILTLGLWLAASPVYAGGGGGGGTKRNGTIRFVNHSKVQVGVTSNANSTAILAAVAAGSLSEFIAAGGKVLNAGGSATFSVQAGTYTVGAANVMNSGAFVPITKSVSVSQGQTVTVNIQNATSGSNTIQFGS